jgi:hypothetical protein
LENLQQKLEINKISLQKNNSKLLSSPSSPRREKDCLGAGSETGMDNRENS